jgi:hypothetical protein
MKVRMKRRFRQGVELDDQAFSSQEWTTGVLELINGVLYISRAGRDQPPGPSGILHRPGLKAVFSDTISFHGIEQAGNAWVVQVWFCEVRGA